MIFYYSLKDMFLHLELKIEGFGKQHYRKSVCRAEKDASATLLLRMLRIGVT